MDIQPIVGKHCWRKTASPGILYKTDETLEESTWTGDPHKQYAITWHTAKFNKEPENHCKNNLFFQMFIEIVFGIELLIVSFVFNVQEGNFCSYWMRQNGIIHTSITLATSCLHRWKMDPKVEQRPDSNTIFTPCSTVEKEYTNSTLPKKNLVWMRTRCRGIVMIKPRELHVE